MLPPLSDTEDVHILVGDYVVGIMRFSCCQLDLVTLCIDLHRFLPGPRLAITTMYFASYAFAQKNEFGTECFELWDNEC